MLTGWRKEERQIDDEEQKSVGEKKSKYNDREDEKREDEGMIIKLIDDIIDDVTENKPNVDDWDEALKEHRLIIEEEVKKKDKEERASNKMIESYNQSWELLKHCVEFLRENDLTWQKGQEERKKEMERKERLEKAKYKQAIAKRNHVEKKINEHFMKLPVKEQEKIEREEMKRNRLELITIKKELWQYRGKENRGKEKPRMRGENEKLRERMEKIIEINVKLKAEKLEEEDRKRRQEKIKEELRKKRKLEEIKRIEVMEEKRKQKEKKEKREKHWEMAKWLYKYVEENNFKWEREKLRRMEERRQLLEDWDRNSRLRKIEILKKKFRRGSGDIREEEKRTPPPVPEEREKWRGKKGGEEMEEEGDSAEEMFNLFNGEEIKSVKLDVKIREPKLNNDNEIYANNDDEELVMMLGEEEEEPDLGGDSFCLNCALKPCICLMLKLEMKIEALKSEESGNIKNREITEVGRGASKIITSFGSAPPSQLPHQGENIPPETYGEAGLHHVGVRIPWVTELLEEIINDLPRITSMPPSLTNNTQKGNMKTRKLKQNLLDKYLNRSKNNSPVNKPRIKLIPRVESLVTNITKDNKNNDNMGYLTSQKVNSIKKEDNANLTHVRLGRLVTKPIPTPRPETKDTEKGVLVTRGDNMGRPTSSKVNIIDNNIVNLAHEHMKHENQPVQPVPSILRQDKTSRAIGPAPSPPTLGTTKLGQPPPTTHNPTQSGARIKGKLPMKLFEKYNEMLGGKENLKPPDQPPATTHTQPSNPTNRKTSPKETPNPGKGRNLDAEPKLFTEEPKRLSAPTHPRNVKLIPTFRTNQPDHPQTPTNPAKLSDQSRTNTGKKLGIDRSKPGSVTKRSERERKKEKERNINLKLSEKLKGWLKLEEKEKPDLKVTKNDGKFEEKKTVNKLIGIFENKKNLLQNQTGQSNSTVESGEVNTTSSSTQQRKAELNSIMMGRNSTQEYRGS